MPYALSHAQDHAKAVTAAIAPYCLRAETAGSTRRKEPNPKDVELVSVPNPLYFSELKAIVNARWGKPKIGPFPSKYTAIRSILNLDLFWATKENFGLVLFIRTGPKGFVIRALAHWKQITNGGYSDEAVLWKPNGQGGFEPVPTPEEADVFTALNRKFVPPEHRYENLEQQKRYHQRQRSDAR